MPPTVYLEAAARTQALLTAKWTLRSCGCAVASTWHDEPILASTGPRSHWTWRRLEEVKSCDTLVIVRGEEKEIPPGLALVVGFAAARNMRVIWLGAPIDVADCLKNVQFFATLDEFRAYLFHASDEVAA